ncbi:F-box only protein 36 isoform X1 [Elephas maximus indicus]|uniref:F-box only protein 36 isoform X1 n=1 Tax=Elephas maximus indicus TaxID=99487 RepID=UPI0021169087|nr:F-box only protein 36 isoform X1 [Elephas maximus indicus]
MTPSKSRPFLVVLATAVASQDGVVAAGDSVRNCRTRPGSKQRLLPVIGYPVPGSYPQSSLRAKRKTGVPACVQPPFSVGRRERKTQPSVPRRSRQGWGESDDLFSRIIFRWWKISLRSEYRAAKPGEAKESHEDFLENSHLQVQVALIFGARILDYVLNLCQGKFDFLERLSDTLLLSIISYLDLEDIARLSQTSHRFAKLCVCDTLWEQIVQSACDTITPDMRALAEDIGWKEMFFTNKLQLQRQLRKRKQKHGSLREQDQP